MTTVSLSKKASFHLSPNLTAHDQARKYPTGIFHVDHGLMFCLSCNIVIDHLWKSVVDKHLDSALHKQRAERNLGIKQQTLTTVLNCKTLAQIEKVKICQEWMIQVWAAANIPLHKSDNPMMCKFLQAQVAKGGTIPKCLLHVQLAFLKVKASTLMTYLNYFKERIPHITQAHRKMERLLHYMYLDVNSKLEEKDLTFCFEVEHTFTGTVSKEGVPLFS